MIIRVFFFLDFRDEINSFVLEYCENDDIIFGLFSIRGGVVDEIRMEKGFVSYIVVIKGYFCFS